MEVTTSAARAVADYLALELTRMFLFLVSFALVLLLWLLLSRVLDLACKLPVLSTLNHWSGAALGLVKGGLIVFILCWLLRGSLISQEAVEGTVLLRFFCTHTPLSLLAPLLFRCVSLCVPSLFLRIHDKFTFRGYPVFVPKNFSLPEGVFA